MSTAPQRSLPGFSRWAGRSDAEQVRLYTVASLHSLAWFLLAMAALSASPRVGGVGAVLALVAAAVVLGLAVSRVTVRATADAARVLSLREVAGPILVVVVVLGALTGWGAWLGGRAGASVALVGIGALAWAAGVSADARLRGAAVAVSALAAYAASGTVVDALIGALVAAFLTYTMVSSLWLLRIVMELDRARATQAALAVAEERLRFSRDVHDVLGRYLSTAAVQSELAATLVRRGDPRAADKVLEVRATAHDALREARELARGYRPLDLQQELDGAVSLLRSAGIRAQAHVDDLAEAWHEPVARVVREAVTNVLRHSDAASVRIEGTHRVVEIVDDGSSRPTGSDETDGTGLAALRESVESLGASLEAGPVDDGWRVRLSLADAAPRRTEVSS